MSKLSLTSPTSGYNTAITEQANNAAIVTALDNTLSRDGTSPNQMNALLDMNSNKIINLGAPSVSSDAARYLDTLASFVSITNIVAPALASHSGQVLGTDGAAVFWRDVGGALAPLHYDRTSAEIAAGVTPTNYSYVPGNVLRYGADLSGIVDAAPAVQNAVASNLTVIFPEGTYKIATQVLSTAKATSFIGAGRGSTTINIVTNTDAFQWTGSSSGGGIRRLTLNVAGQTGGYAINCTNSNRFLIEDINIVGTSTSTGAIFTADFNSYTIRDVWMNGVYGTNGFAIKALGNTSASANVLDISNVEYGGTASSTATTFLAIDGGVNSVEIRHVGAVGTKAGIVTLNTPALAAFAPFIEGLDVEIDGCWGDGITFGTPAGVGTTSQHNFNELYIHNCGTGNAGTGAGNGNGIYAYANSRDIHIQGGDILTCNLNAVFNDGNQFTMGNIRAVKCSQLSVGTYPMVQLGANSYECNLHNNSFGQHTGAATADTSYGIQIEIGSKRNIIVENILLSNTLGAINDLAKDPNSIIDRNLYFGRTPFNTSLTPAALGTGPLNNVTVTNISQNVSRLLLTPAAGGTTINGLWSGGSASVFGDGAVLLIRNISAADSITFKHLNGGSSTWNQFSLPGAVDLVLGPLAAKQFMYNGIDNKWEPI